jgi:hypothetical protein
MWWSHLPPPDEFRHAVPHQLTNYSTSPSRSGEMASRFSACGLASCRCEDAKPQAEKLASYIGLVPKSHSPLPGNGTGGAAPPPGGIVTLGTGTGGPAGTPTAGTGAGATPGGGGSPGPPTGTGTGAPGAPGVPPCGMHTPPRLAPGVPAGMRPGLIQSSRSATGAVLHPASSNSRMTQSRFIVPPADSAAGPYGVRKRITHR